MTEKRWVAKLSGLLHAEDLEDGRKRRLLTPLSLTIRCGEGYTGLLEQLPLEDRVFTITVPPGFISDGASIPRPFWNILRPWGKHARAAVLHDWLYFTGEFPKETADWIFLVVMEAIGVTWWKRRTMYRAVICFGQGAWDGYRKSTIEN